MIRRSFLCFSARMTCGLAAPGIFSGLALGGQKTTSLDESYLQLGLNALARAHHMSSMAGHLGASMIAAYFVGRQRPELDARVVRGIQDDLDRILKGQSVFGKKMSKKSTLSDAELFDPLPKQTPDETLVDRIAEGLEQGITKPRQSGHNVIFASLAIGALQEHPELTTPAVVEGILKLMDLFANQSPGSGYYGKSRGRIKGNQVDLPEEDGTPAYDSIDSMVNVVLGELIDLDPKVHRSGYGGMVHIINHCAAIVSLADQGYEGLAQQAIRSHRQHLRLWRNLPDVSQERGQLQISPHTPHSPEYWNSGEVPYDRALLTHRIKTMYGFDQVASAVEQEEKERAAYDKLRYLM